MKFKSMILVLITLCLFTLTACEPKTSQSGGKRQVAIPTFLLTRKRSVIPIPLMILTIRFFKEIHSIF